MNIVAATESFELWLREQTEVRESDLQYKYDEMADRNDPFPFFRGAYYRWVQRWKKSGERWSDAPVVLAVGDIHVENFGNWRDSEGRLVWGVNDLDEADELPYTHDLVRLAASAWFANRSTPLPLKWGRICRLLLEGYSQQLTSTAPAPFVLEEHHGHLRQLAMAGDRDPKKFWKKINKVLKSPVVKPPVEARDALIRSLPSEKLSIQFRFREQVGMGSLGKPRYVALADWRGSQIAREAKAVTPPSTQWAESGRRRVKSRIEAVLRNAVRCHDPFFVVGARWTTRRLAPRCSRIELESLSQTEDFAQLFQSMGAELANIHLGSEAARDAIAKDLDNRPNSWLEKAASKLCDDIIDDWSDWKKHRKNRAAKKKR
ncbi:MAG: DUF2252 family protein [Pirellulales bacterium]